MLADLISNLKPQIANTISSYLGSRRDEPALFPLDGQLLNMLESFVVSGKLLRGVILVSVYESLVRNTDTKTAMQAAAALELLESGLLIQDDVMDNDNKRRGNESIHVQLAAIDSHIPTDRTDAFGRHAATTLGDVAFFLSYDLLSRGIRDPDTYRKLADLYSRELARVSLAQIRDLQISATGGDIDEKDILDMYAGKTSRYTIVIPLQAARILALADELFAQTFESVGRNMGLIYQLVDDTIGLFGDEQHIGKPVGSDVREGKKTIYYLYALQHGSPDDRSQLKKIWGNGSISDAEILLVRNIMEKTGARGYVRQYIDTLSEKIRKEIHMSRLPDDTKSLIMDIESYLARRVM